MLGLSTWPCQLGCRSLFPRAHSTEGAENTGSVGMSTLFLA